MVRPVWLHIHCESSPEWTIVSGQVLITFQIRSVVSSFKFHVYNVIVKSTFTVNKTEIKHLWITWLCSVNNMASKQRKKRWILIDIRENLQIILVIWWVIAILFGVWGTSWLCWERGAGYPLNIVKMAILETYSHTARNKCVRGLHDRVR